jgi:N5-(cytidine 5'-diphosphoramidyl)-L-glutamine hydrolase
MKIVFVTQRVDVLAQRGERRDALDQRVAATLAACGLVAIPVPNDAAVAVRLWHAKAPDGVVLSGGNDLCDYGGDAPERDATERALLDLAVQARLPVFGICRGLQMLTHYLGGALHAITGHAGTRHRVHGEQGAFDTNSFHNWGIARLPEQTRILYRADDESVEAWRHAVLPLCGVMWHPEREATLAEEDRRLIHEHFA